MRGDERRQFEGGRGPRWPRLRWWSRQRPV